MRLYSDSAPDDRFAPARTSEPRLKLPSDENASVDAALANNKEVQRLESAMQARGLEARAVRASWLPQIDLIAQYALLAKYNNYEQYFDAFQRHNGQLGASIALPIFAGRGAEARATQADLEVRRLTTQVNAVREPDNSRHPQGFP